MVKKILFILLFPTIAVAQGYVSDIATLNTALQPIGSTFVTLDGYRSRANPGAGSYIMDIEYNGTASSPASYWYVARYRCTGAGNGVGLFSYGTAAGAVDSSEVYGVYGIGGIYDGYFPGTGIWSYKYYSDSIRILNGGGRQKLYFNNSGATLYMGQIVEGDSADGSVAIYRRIKKAIANTLSAIGTVADESIATGNWGWIWESGEGVVAVLNATTATIRASDRILTTSATAGLADCEVTVSVVNHFKEIGHPLGNKKFGINTNGDSLIYYKWHDL